MTKLKFKSDIFKGPLVNRFWNGKHDCDVLCVGGLACDVLKFAFLHRFFHNEEIFSKRIKSSTNKAWTISYHIKRILTLIHLSTTPKTHVWFEANFILLLHTAAIIKHCIWQAINF